ncbi:hypothetical protein DPMN_074057 [Dreissena polymorpha]|uniref:Uncharacterized protein n=1 Tax=Dreissena polymorpha TaxID=45954 RepID=A0A9D3YIY2_DREPO|nr:hypothetical protein DPMN_074057 [Dreissena polymorpha]
MDGNLPPRKSCHEMDATKIDELITKGQIEVQCGRTAEAKRHAREAQVRAEESMHRYLQSDADNEAEKKLTDWFRECCAIFAEIEEFPMALKCFYLATCFDDTWTTETHTRVSQTLWNKMHDIQQKQRSSTVEEIQQLLGD